MCKQHVLVASSPLYLLGLEAVISQHVKEPGFIICRSAEEARQKLVNTPRGFLWWAIQTPQSELIVNTISPFISKYPEMRIILLQHVYDTGIVKKLFEYGIAGFLSDMCSTDEICEAIHTTASGNTYLDRRVANAVSLSYLNPQVKQSKCSESLTDREKEVLKLIVDEYTTREIAQKLYISKCTVETHRLHLIRKLGVKNTAGLVREALTQALCRALA